jgi:hypothetical protein
MPKKKINIEYCHECAKSIGWECLSQEYHNQQDMLTWKCPEGHVQKKSLAYFRRTIRKKGWCPYCTGKNLFPLEDCKNMANEMGGECLSEVFVNNREPMVWRCAYGHQWNASKTSAKKIWCKTCKNQLLEDYFLKDTIQGLSEFNLSVTDPNITDKEFVEKVLLFLKTPENGRKKRSKTRKMVEDCFKSMMMKDSVVQKSGIKKYWSIFLKTLPVSMKIIKERNQHLKMFNILKKTGETFTFEEYLIWFQHAVKEEIVERLKEENRKILETLLKFKTQGGNNEQ